MALIEEVFVFLQLVLIVILVTRVSLAVIWPRNMLVGILGLSVVVTTKISGLARWHQRSFLFIIVLGE